MNGLDVWGPAIVASIVGVVAAAAFTWFFNFRTDRERKQGVRALVSQELMHNEAALRTLVSSLKLILQQDAGYARAFRAMPRTPHWQNSRWELPDVGNAFVPEELTRYSEWYFGLDGVTFLYEQLVGEVLEWARPQPHSNMGRGPVPLSEELADVLIKPQISEMVNYAEELLKNRPPAPDKRLDRDPDMRRYLQELQGRSAATSPD